MVIKIDQATKVLDPTKESEGMQRWETTMTNMVIGSATLEVEEAIVLRVQEMEAGMEEEIIVIIENIAKTEAAPEDIMIDTAVTEKTEEDTDPTPMILMVQVIHTTETRTGDKRTANVIEEAHTTVTILSLTTRHLKIERDQSLIDEL